MSYPSGMPQGEQVVHPLWESPVQYVKGIGPRRAAALKEVGILTGADLFLHLPRRFLDRSNVVTIDRLRPDETVTVVGKIAASGVIRGRKNRFEAVMVDGTGQLPLVWFSGIRWVAEALKKNVRLAVSGKVQYYYGVQMTHPEYEILENEDADDFTHTGRVIPVYPSGEEWRAARLEPRTLRRIIKPLVTGPGAVFHDYLPPAVPEKVALPDLGWAIANAHYPQTTKDAERARERLAFDELLFLQLTLAGRREQIDARQDGRACPAKGVLARQLVDALPWKLTGAQKRVISEITADLRSPRAMRRLLQGDVGSGKTVVAAVAMALWAEPGTGTGPMGVSKDKGNAQDVGSDRDCFVASSRLRRDSVPRNDPPKQSLRAKRSNPVVEVSSAPTADSFQHGPLPGAQAALLVPTEILAEQHHHTLTRLFAPLGMESVLITGSLKAKERRERLALVASGEAKIIVGTHALLSENVEYHDLGLVVIDEQHRFGVAQRQTLVEKGHRPDLLVMTATPIPRTLALTLYGDLDVSVLGEKPPQKGTIRTVWRTGEAREKIYGYIRTAAKRGDLTYIVYPLVEQSEKSDLKAAVAGYEELQEHLAGLRIGLVHGRIKTAERQAVMEAFYAGALDVLVSTTVIEVGVDAPAARLMIIENADRFGLSQLHQLRGRIGRGPGESICVLMVEKRANPIAQERLDVLCTTDDGFVIAEHDLRLRGPGEFLGTRQHGLPEFRIANLIRDAALVEPARQAAAELSGRVGEWPLLKR
ncbi:MAG: ATP-dependent DNA helicase RecG, partial [Candidatus Zixiibacteriota bacterium]